MAWSIALRSTSVTTIEKHWPAPSNLQNSSPALGKWWKSPPNAIHHPQMWNDGHNLGFNSWHISTNTKTNALHSQLYFSFAENLINAQLINLQTIKCKPAPSGYQNWKGMGVIDQTLTHTPCSWCQATNEGPQSCCAVLCGLHESFRSWSLHQTVYLVIMLLVYLYGWALYSFKWQLHFLQSNKIPKVWKQQSLYSYS